MPKIENDGWHVYFADKPLPESDKSYIVVVRWGQNDIQTTELWRTDSGWCEMNGTPIRSDNVILAWKEMPEVPERFKQSV